MNSYIKEEENEIVKKAGKICRAINHKFRRQIISILADNETMSVTDLYVKMRCEQSVASQHLRLLREAKIVNTIRDGKYIYYSVNKEKIAQVIAKFKEVV